MDVARRIYSRDLNSAAMREIDGGPRMPRVGVKAAKGRGVTFGRKRKPQAQSRFYRLRIKYEMRPVWPHSVCF
jgi:hypothetical protein